MQLTPTSKLKDLLKEFPFLLDFLIEYNPKFELLKSKIMRATMGRVASMKRIAAVGEIEDLPAVYALGQNEPNPSDMRAAIRFDLPKLGVVSLKILDAEGRLVKTLVNGVQPAGRHSVIWLGDDDRENTVGSGIYFVRIETGGLVDTEKMILLQ